MKFKRYLNGVGDAGTRLLFKLRSGTHGLDEELGRHRGREGKYMSKLCGEDCESVGHFLWNFQVDLERRALLTLGAHAHSEGYSSCRVCMYVCVCMCVCMCDHS